MVWALAFAILLKLLGGGSPFLIPKLDNYVKKHVQDDTRKKEVLVLLKDAKKNRKATAKQNKKHFKEIHKLYKSRDTETADFETVLNEILKTQEEAQKYNITVNQESQELINEEEWAAIHIDIKESLGKTDKKRTKNRLKMEKHFLKTEAKITKNIANLEKRTQAIAAVEKLKNLYVKNHQIIQDEIMNENSIVYQYKASNKELIVLQDEFVDLIKDVYVLSFKTHQELVNLTTPEEWKKIQ